MRNGCEGGTREGRGMMGGKKISWWTAAMLS